MFDFIAEEQQRQERQINLIASENFCSEDVMKAVGSCLTNKYAEGYPGYRYYGGCEVVDELELYCQKKWQEAFNTDYFVNVQPHSGTQANEAVYYALLNPGDTVLSMSLDCGGHLSHFSPASISGKLYNPVFYGLDEDGIIDYYDLSKKIRTHKPKLILAGASSYSREIKFGLIKKIIDIEMSVDPDYHPIFMVDMAHIAGLIVGGEHVSPFGLADVITTTTHKTLRSTRGGMVFSRTEELAKKINSAVFPRNQGGPLMHAIAGKAVAAEEACTEEYKEYISKVVLNTYTMCEQFKKMGYEIVSGGTDNHLFMIDLTNTHPNVTGKMVQDALEEKGIAVNKNCVPGDKRSPTETSGIRIGCAAMTTKGFGPLDFVGCAIKIDEIICSLDKK